MQETKLWQLIKRFPAHYLREASRFVNSSFFNRKKQCSMLWEYLLFHINRSNPLPNHQEAFQRLYPGLEYDNAKLRLAISDLYKLLLQFLAFKEWEQQIGVQELYQAKALRKLGLEKYARQNLKLSTQVLSKSNLRNADFFQISYEILAEHYIMDYRSSPDKSASLQLLSDTADLALLSAKLRQSCLALAHQGVYTASHQLGFTSLVMKYIEERALLKEPAISIYYYCFFMLQEASDESHFKQFKALLLANGQLFEQSEIRDLYLMGINYAIRQVNAGKEHYFNEIMTLYEAALEGDYLLENGQLSRFTYNNIVAAGIRTERYDWVEQFIHAYRLKLASLYRESSFSFCLARLAYNRKNFHIALPLLQKANYRDPLLNLAAKTLLLKIYYELDEYDLLHAHLDAMQNYILRKKVIAYHKTNYLNIIRHTRKLMSLNFFDTQAIKKRKSEVEEEAILTEKRWLLAQLNV